MSSRMRKAAPNPVRSLSRRQFLKASGMTALLAHLPSGWVGRVFANDAPETPQIRIGIIALTDCSSIVIAYEKGFFKQHGLDVTVSKEASWAVIRDKLQLGENHATHMLYGMPYASTMGLFGAPVKPMIIPWVLNYNGQAITLSNELKDKGIRGPADLKKLLDEEKAAGKSPRTFAMTFPPGTHAMWIRYWLGAGGINPDKDVSLITIPPPQMVANMTVGKMDGFCKEIILVRLLGKYDYGDGQGEHEDKDYMRFYERGVNFPWKSHGVWWLSQFRRWGMVKEAPDYKKIVDQVHRPDIYREVAKEMGIAAPTEDLKPEKLFDGVSFDPTKPEEYAKAFAVKNLVEV